MITEAIIKILWTPILALIRLFPLATGNTMANITSALDYWFAVLKPFDIIVPFDTLIDVIGLVLAIEGSILIYRVIMSIMSFITLGKTLNRATQ